MTLTLHVGPRIARYTDEERERHEEQSVCKARGGSPLLLGARSGGRWDPACSCGWRASSNEDKREAVAAWREHRANAIYEERRLAVGQPIYRVLVRDPVYEPDDVRQEWRGFQSEEAAHARARWETGGYPRRFGTVERSTDGQTWEVLAPAGDLTS